MTSKYYNLWIYDGFNIRVYTFKSLSERENAKKYVDNPYVFARLYSQVRFFRNNGYVSVDDTFRKQRTLSPSVVLDV